MQSTLCSHGFPIPRPPQPWEPPALAPGKTLQQCCLETNKVLQWMPPDWLPPLPQLWPDKGSMSGTLTMSCWLPSLPSPWVGGWAEGLCQEKAAS